MEGKDEDYDNIGAEIARLEKSLDQKLKKLEDEVGYVSVIVSIEPGYLMHELSTDLTYWHSALGTKVCRRNFRTCASYSIQKGYLSSPN
jgi:hypothetical protein